MRGERDSDVDVESNTSTINTMHDNHGEIGTELTNIRDETDRDSVVMMKNLTREKPVIMNLKSEDDHLPEDEEHGLSRESLAMVKELSLRESQYKASLNAGKYGNLASLLIRYRKGKLDPGSRKDEIKQKFEYQRLQEDWKQDLVEFFVAFDPCFIVDINIEDAWMAIKRREAWRRKPWTLAFVHFTQFSLAIFASVSQNSDVNASTMVMAVLYVFILMVQKEFKVTHELLNDFLIKDVYDKHIKEKYSKPFGYFLAFLPLPCFS